MSVTATHPSREKRMNGISHGRGFGVKGNGKRDTALVEIPTLQQLSQIVAPEAIADEWGVISCILTSVDSHEVFLRVQSLLEAKHFAFPMLADIWRVMCQMHRDKLPIDYALLQCVLQDTYDKHQQFFEEFVPKMYSSTHNPEHVMVYAERILNKYHRRVLIETFSEGIGASVSHIDPIDALAQMERNLAEVKQEFHNTGRQTGSSFRSLLSNYLIDLSDQAKGVKQSGVINTGSWYDFNSAAQGFAPGDFIVLAAPTSCGKSMAGINLAREFALEGHATLYVSLEMTQQTVLERIMSPVIGFSAGAMSRTGVVTPEKLEAIRAFQEKYANLPISIKKPHNNSYDGFYKSVSEAESEFKEERTDFKGFRVVVVDYLQLLAANVEAKYKTQEIDRVAQLLRNFALETGATVIALAQYDTDTARAAAKEPEGLHCLSYCKTIDHHATQIIFMHHPNFGDRKRLHEANYIDFIWGKNRDGINGRVRMGVDWTKGWLYSTTNSDDIKREPAKSKHDPWDELAKKYGVSPEQAEPIRDKVEVDAETEAASLPPLPEPDQMIALAAPKGIEAQPEQPEADAVEVVVVPDESSAVTASLAPTPTEEPSEHEPAKSKEEPKDNSGTEDAGEIVVGSTVYKDGETVAFMPGFNPDETFPVTLRILDGRAVVVHLTTEATKDSVYKATGQRFRWKKDDVISNVHLSRLSKFRG